MFWFLLIALVVVVAAVTLAVAGGGGDGTGGEAALPEAVHDRMAWPLPAARPLGRADVEELRLPLALRGYRMAETDDALDRLGAELAERDARIAELEAALAGAQAAAIGVRGLLERESGGAAEERERPEEQEPQEPQDSPGKGKTS
ncbi:DivIVA domain-containing protein [Streptomyces abikoensis]|uniref:DivIVA domain-containing protein n=1 Tax=Streptomyces abikoensis TaxID=97398 RepID=A0ABW7SXT6_9ACTN